MTEHTGRTGRAVLLVTLGNLLPLLFVATGTLDLPLLLVCYGIEAVLLPGDPEATAGDTLKLRVTAFVLVAILLARALFAVEWSLGTLAVLAATVVLTLAGPWLARRDPGSADGAGGDRRRAVAGAAHLRRGRRGPRTPRTSPC